MSAQAPTSGPLSGDDVKLLLKGDWLSDGFYDPWQFSHIENGTVYGLDGYTAMIEPLLLRNSFIGRPGADGWMPWSGGENPVPGHRIDWVNARGDEGSHLSDEVCGFGAPLGGNSPVVKWRPYRLAPTAPVEASGSEREEVDRLAKVYADATDYYVQFHRGLSSPSSDQIRKSIRAVLAALRPQPSGETREEMMGGGDVIALVDPTRWNHPTAPQLAYANGWNDRPAPVASGGQHSSGEDAEVLAMLDDYADRHIGATRGEDMFLEEMLISKARERLSVRSSPVAETAGEAVGVVSGCARADLYTADLPTGTPLYAAPVPAQDDDKLRIAVEALEEVASLFDEESYSRTGSIERRAGDKARKALAALKSTAAQGSQD